MEAVANEIPLMTKFGVMVYDDKVVVIDLMKGGVMFSVPASEFDVEGDDYVAYKLHIMRKHYNRLRALQEA